MVFAFTEIRCIFVAENGKRQNSMRKIVAIIIIQLVFLLACAGKEGVRLPLFDVLDMEDGLNSNKVLHTLQLHDGRMVVTTDSCIHLYDGKAFSQYPCTSHEVTKIPDYHGAYHVYADAENRLWVKEWGNVWCMNLDTGSFVELHAMQPMTDVFIDSYGRDVWLVADTMVRTSDAEVYSFRREWENLQDLDADSLHLYLFFSTGKVACYDRNDHRLLYTSQPQAFAEDENRETPLYLDYDETSLVVRGKNGEFYQLRSGRRFIFLCFNPESREWRTVFETSTGAFYSLCVPTGELALIGCPTGVWSIGLQTGEMSLHSSLETADGSVLHTGVNSVLCDRHGGLWLGTGHAGVLRADTIYAPRSYTLYYIVAALGLGLLLVVLFFHHYATRQRCRERQLMQRIQELVSAGLSDSSEKEVELSCEEDMQTSSDEFLSRAITLVEQNLHTPGYTVERLAADLCMERTGLYRKLNALVNQSPTLFIRRIRMERAAQMLLEGKLTVSEIAERTGFSSPSYFSRLFQETYGCKPSEYRK